MDRHRLALLLRGTVLGSALGAVLGTVLLGGCGGSPYQPPPVPPPAATTTPPLPWPVGDPAAVAVLQERVDGGAQPWLLDPGEVATGFGSAAYGWQQAHAVLPDHRGRTDVPVELHGPDGRVAHLVLAQPGRTGTGGIWVVTRASDP